MSCIHLLQTSKYFLVIFVYPPDIAPRFVFNPLPRTALSVIFQAWRTPHATLLHLHVPFTPPLHRSSRASRSAIRECVGVMWPAKGHGGIYILPLGTLGCLFVGRDFLVVRLAFSNRNTSRLESFLFVLSMTN
jgi:hypothetical protein